MTVEISKHEQAIVASIDDGKANALTFEVVGRLRIAIGAAVEAGRPLVITGREGQFCAGFDLSVMAGEDADAATALFHDGIRLYTEVMSAPVPVVAACTGHALAGGALLLLAADYRVGAPGAFKIGLNEVEIGWAVPRSVLVLARHRLNPQHLTAATLLAEVTAPDRAVDFGYLDAVQSDALSSALTLAGRLAGLPPHAFAVTKRRLRESTLVALAEAEP